MNQEPDTNTANSTEIPRKITGMLISRVKAFVIHVFILGSRLHIEVFQAVPSTQPRTYINTRNSAVTLIDSNTKQIHKENREHPARSPRRRSLTSLPGRLTKKERNEGSSSPSQPPRELRREPLRANLWRLNDSLLGKSEKTAAESRQYTNDNVRRTH